MLDRVKIGGRWRANHHSTLTAWSILMHFCQNDSDTRFLKKVWWEPEHVRFLESTSMQMQIMTDKLDLDLFNESFNHFTHVSTIDLLPSAVKNVSFFYTHLQASHWLQQGVSSLCATPRGYICHERHHDFTAVYVSFSYLQAIFVMRDHTEFVKHVIFLWVIKTITFYDSFVHFTSAENIVFLKSRFIYGTSSRVVWNFYQLIIRNIVLHFFKKDT